MNPFSKESRSWWDCGVKAYDEWTQEGFGRNQYEIMSAGNFTRYQGSMHVSV